MKGAEHHLHMRRRAHTKTGIYPHPRRLQKYTDMVVLIIGVIGPLFSIPQVLRIWVQNETEGLSMPTWIAYLSFSIVWTAYGIVHKEKLIAVSNGIFVLMNVLVVVGIILF